MNLPNYGELMMDAAERTIERAERQIPVASGCANLPFEGLPLTVCVASTYDYVAAWPQLQNSM
jgi:hypothetical protein